MSNTQKAIDSVCEYRGLPKVLKGQPVEVDGKKGEIVGGNHAANFNVKFGKGRPMNCHPYWRMTIYNTDGSVLYRHKDANNG